MIYPGQFHGITTPSYKKDRLERYLDWYGRYPDVRRPRRRQPAGRPAASSLRLVFVRAEDVLGDRDVVALRQPLVVESRRVPVALQSVAGAIAFDRTEMLVEMACVIFGFGWDVESVMVRVPGIE